MSFRPKFSMKSRDHQNRPSTESESGEANEVFVPSDASDIARHYDEARRPQEDATTHTPSSTANVAEVVPEQSVTPTPVNVVADVVIEDLGPEDSIYGVSEIELDSSPEQKPEVETPAQPNIVPSIPSPKPLKPQDTEDETHAVSDASNISPLNGAWASVVHDASSEKLPSPSESRKWRDRLCMRNRKVETPKVGFEIRRKPALDDDGIVAGLKKFSVPNPGPSTINIDLLIEKSVNIKNDKLVGGIFNYSMTICVGTNGPIFQSLAKQLLKNISDEDSRMTGGKLWFLNHASGRRHTVLVFNTHFDWTMSLALFLSTADGASLGDRRIKVVFDKMCDAHYRQMPAILQGCSGLSLTFAVPIFTPSIVREIIIALQASLPATKEGSTYYTAFSQTTRAKNQNAYLVTPPSTAVTCREKQLLAMSEYAVYSQRFRTRMAEICGPVFKDMLNGVNLPNHLHNQYNLWDTRTKTFVYPDQWNRKWSDVTCGYTDAGLIPWDTREANFNTTGKVLVAKDLAIVLDERFLQIAKNTEVVAAALPALFWLNGPPGCGKSTILLNSFKSHPIHSTMILAITTSATEDLRARMMHEDGVEPEIAKKYIRTTMSLALMDDAKLRSYRKLERVFVDEATMMHPGAVLYAVCRLPSVQIVVMVGDRNQIPFVDRLHVGILQFSSPSAIANSLPQISVTYRCPQDIVYSLRHLYDGLHTTNEILRSVSVNRTSIPLTVSALYLTFTQAEKAEITNKVKDVVGAKVLTITEAQGLTFDHVIVSRLQVNDLAIYSDKYQAVTAFTRHRKSLTYFTVSQSSDALTGFIETALTGKDEDIIRNNKDNAATGLGKPSLKGVLNSVGLRVGGDLYIPDMTEEFYQTLSLAGNIPTFRNFRLPASLGISSLTLALAHYYRGPLTQWRLGDIGSTAPCPPSQLMTLAFSRTLTASKSLIWKICARISCNWLPLLLSTGACVALGLYCRYRRTPTIDSTPVNPAGLAYLSTFRTKQPSSPPSPTLQLGHRDVQSIQVYGHLPPHTEQQTDSETVPKSSTPPPASFTTLKNNSPAPTPVSSTSPIPQESKEPTLSTASAPSPGPKKSSAPKATLSLPSEKLKRIGGPVQDLNVQNVKRLQSINTKMAVLPYKVNTLVSSLLAPLKKNKVRFVSSEELLQSVDHVTNAFTPEIAPALPYPKVVAPRSVHSRSGSIANLQFWYEMAFPAAIGVDYSQDSDIVQNSDIKIAVDGITLDTDRANYLAPLFDSLRPTLRTMMSARRPATQLETILGFAKRNGNVPKLAVGYPPEYIASLLLENYIESVISDRVAFEDFINHPIKPSVESLDKWIATQDNPEILRFLSQSVEPVETRVYNVFSYMIKQAVKAPSSNADASKYQSVQTIAFQPKDVNIIFCPIFVELRNRLLAVMNPKFIFYTGMSPDDLENEINSRFDASTLFSCERVENDIGKYDKSMPAYYLIFEIALFMKLGLDPYLAEIWYNSHVRSLYTDRSSGFSAIVDFQRRSGDASTFLGNTIINQAACVAVYNPRDITCGLYAGDDHLIFGKNISYDTAGIFADLFNFEAKTLATLKYPYFCGKFLIHSGPYVYIVPDPIRTVTKMGRRDLRNSDHVEEYRTSMRDVTAPLNNVYVEFSLNSAITERYRTEFTEHNILIDSILFLVNNKKEFHKLYTSEGHFVLNFDPSRHDIDL